MKQLLIFIVYMLSYLAFLVLAVLVCVSATLFPRRFY